MKVLCGKTLLLPHFFTFLIIYVPNLRFKEFTKEWKITTLGKCSKKLEYGLGASAIEYDGIHKYIRITSNI